MTKKTIKKFAGNRSLEDIKAAVLKAGGQWFDTLYRERGSDYISFTFEGRTILWNTFNGNFIVNEGSKYITGESELDGVEWFDNLLALLYTTKKAVRRG